MMTRRGLLSMVLGTLGAVACAPVSQVVKNVSAVRHGTPVAELFISVSSDVTGGLAGFKPGVTVIQSGPLMIRTEAEAQAFLRQMVNAIVVADRRAA